MPQRRDRIGLGERIFLPVKYDRRRVRPDARFRARRVLRHLACHIARQRLFQLDGNRIVLLQAIPARHRDLCAVADNMAHQIAAHAACYLRHLRGRVILRPRDAVLRDDIGMSLRRAGRRGIPIAVAAVHAVAADDADITGSRVPAAAALGVVRLIELHIMMRAGRAVLLRARAVFNQTAVCAARFGKRILSAGRRDGDRLIAVRRAGQLAHPDGIGKVCAPLELHVVVFLIRRARLCHIAVVIGVVIALLILPAIAGRIGIIVRVPAGHVGVIGGNIDIQIAVGNCQPRNRRIADRHVRFTQVIDHVKRRAAEFLRIVAHRADLVVLLHPDDLAGLQIVGQDAVGDVKINHAVIQRHRQRQLRVYLFILLMQGIQLRNQLVFLHLSGLRIARRAAVKVDQRRVRGSFIVTGRLPADNFVLRVVRIAAVRIPDRREQILGIIGIVKIAVAIAVYIARGIVHPRVVFIACVCRHTLVQRQNFGAGIVAVQRARAGVTDQKEHVIHHAVCLDALAQHTFDVHVILECSLGINIDKARVNIIPLAVNFDRVPEMLRGEGFLCLAKQREVRHIVKHHAVHDVSRVRAERIGRRVDGLCRLLCDRLRRHLRGRRVSVVAAVPGGSNTAAVLIERIIQRIARVVRRLHRCRNILRGRRGNIVQLLHSLPGIRVCGQRLAVRRVNLRIHPLNQIGVRIGIRGADTLVQRQRADRAGGPHVLHRGGQLRGGRGSVIAVARIHFTKVLVHILIMLALLRVGRFQHGVSRHIHNVHRVKRRMICEPLVEYQQLLRIRLRAGRRDRFQRLILSGQDILAVVQHAEIVAVIECLNGADQLIIRIIAAADVVHRVARQREHRAERAEPVVAVVALFGGVPRRLSAEIRDVFIIMRQILRIQIQNRLNLLVRQHAGRAALRGKRDLAHLACRRGELTAHAVHRDGRVSGDLVLLIRIGNQLGCPRLLEHLVGQRAHCVDIHAVAGDIHRTALREKDVVVNGFLDAAALLLGERGRTAVPGVRRCIGRTPAFRIRRQYFQRLLIQTAAYIARLHGYISVRHVFPDVDRPGGRKCAQRHGGCQQRRCQSFYFHQLFSFLL